MDSSVVVVVVYQSDQGSGFDKINEPIIIVGACAQ
jgi:hypothetical protein